jgi:hypothetical protein
MLRMHEIAFPGFKFQIFSWEVCPRPPKDSCVVCRPHGYPPLIYYLTERSLFKKCPLPNGKILKKGPDKISNKVVYVYCISKAVGQTNTVPPNKIRPIRPCCTWHIMVDMICHPIVIGARVNRVLLL